MSAVIAIIGVLAFTIAYLTWGKLLERVLKVNPSEPTPAVTKYDGVDYVPAKNWLILFGHHFSSIAGAAPIIGPVIALSIWGWGPAVAWIILGSIFMGGVHDMSSLVISIKNEGKSIGEISEDIISSKAKVLFSGFVLLTLILIVAVFAYLASKTLVAEPGVVFPSLGLIPVAMLIGFAMYNLRWNRALLTIIGLILLGGLLWLGLKYPVSVGNVKFWLVVFLIYAGIASVLPVHILLQPRDYLSSFLLFFGIGVGLLGILITRDPIKVPIWVKSGLAWGKGEWSEPLFPLLFVTIACGAISGFHSLVASGTTSKQLATQAHARRIGYGAMLMEGLLALIATLVVASGFSNLAEVRELISSLGPIKVFSQGFHSATKPLLGSLAGGIAIIILNSFILTTLDTATRISRYIIQELFNLRNKYIATLLVILPAGYLAWSGKWKVIWPTFGSANQLVASLSLMVITLWILSRNNSISSSLLTLIPSVLMLAITISALSLTFYKGMISGDVIIALISALLLILAIWMSYLSFVKIKEILKSKGRQNTQESS